MDDYKKYNESYVRIGKSIFTLSLAIDVTLGESAFTDEKKFMEETKAALETIGELIESKKPVKPIDELNNEYDFHWYVCPICGGSVKDGDTGHKFNYCNECGRKMDWSEIDD